MLELPGSITIDSASAAREVVQKKRDEIGQEDFLRMLVAQLENQDPLNPQDGTEFTAQLATFTSLEQQVAMRRSLEELVTAQKTSDPLDQDLRAAMLIGREVRAIGQKLEVTQADLDAPQTAIPIRYSLQSNASSAAIDIHDANGLLVRSLVLSRENREQGLNGITWDGLDALGSPVPTGVYSFQVLASRGRDPIAVQPFTVGIVTGTSLGDGSSVLSLGNRAVTLEDVLEVRRAPDDAV